MKRNSMRTLKILFIIIVFSNFSAFGIKKPGTSASDKNNSTIKIASFNIQIFGKTKLNRPVTLTVLSKIALNFDIIALQEIGSNRSSASDKTCTAIMDSYVARINEIAGEDFYSYIRGDQYAIIYRTDKVRVHDYFLYQGDESFSYTPLIAHFETITPGSNFDFSIITVHTSPKYAESEISSLKTVIEETADHFFEPDVICLGDYNADGSYYDEGSGDWLYGFQVESFITGILNFFDTTVAVSNNTYDRIQMTGSLSSDYSGNSGVFRFGEIYDISGCEGTAATAGTEKAISDHYPVWCEYYTDRDTD